MVVLVVQAQTNYYGTLIATFVPRKTTLKKLTLIHPAILIALAILLSETAFAQRNKKSQKSSITAEKTNQEVEYLFIEAEKLFILKNYSQATEQLNKCLSLMPNNDVVYYKLAEINNITEQFSY